MKLKMSVTFLALGITIFVMSMQIVSGAPGGDRDEDEGRKNLGYKGYGDGGPQNTEKKICHKCRGEKEPNEEPDETPEGHKGKEEHVGHEGHKGKEEHGGHESHKTKEEHEGHEGHKEKEEHGGHEGHKGYGGHESHKGHGGHGGHGDKIADLGKALMKHKEKKLATVLNHKEKVLNGMMDHKEKLLGAAMDHKEKMVETVIGQKAKVAGAMVGAVAGPLATIANPLGGMMKHVGTAQKLGGMFKDKVGDIGQLGNHLKAPFEGILNGNKGHGDHEGHGGHGDHGGSGHHGGHHGY